MEEEKVHESLLKEAQFEVKGESERVTNKLSSVPKKSELENHVYAIESKESQRKIEELESKLKEMATKNQYQLSNALTELKSSKIHILDLETELAIVKEAKIDALREMEMMKTKSQREMEMFIELKEAYTDLKLSAQTTESQIHSLLSEKEAELGLAMEELKNARNKLEILPNLEHELLKKNSIIDNLQAETERVNSLKISSDELYYNTVSELNILKSVLETKETNMEQLESEISQLKIKLQTVVQEAEEIKAENKEIERRETISQIEITMLKSELHKGKARIEAAEASEERAKIEKTELFLTVQQLALELELAKKDNQIQIQEKVKSEEITVENESFITGEVNLRRELESANSKIWELRNRAEQATSRAEAAEKAKAEIEEGITKRREKRANRRAALAALKEETFASSSSNKNIINNEDNDNNDRVHHMITYQPLGKVLNFKF
ncbi:sodium channel and clathrin linker 1-like [Impatiens glandulifera]|uniref:sodium channel and clathrin linker 1-like n=1 Tax=Impatiens glandulifera TaxID=253017 RepID=UPI001FB095EA|nr:sodium channel and clathrin linker 1-like [Impatiens glandulifera]